jgi:nitric oxide reductase activation protein
MGMKIRGVFDQHSEAVEHVKRLIRLDPTFDIYICSMYDWCLVPPDPEHIADQTYQDESLNTLISEYRKNQIFAKEHFEERKRELMEQAADEVRRAALQRIQEESEKELNESLSELNANECHIRAESVVNSDHTVIDITDLDPSPIGDPGPGEVTASELMDQMVNGCKR